MNERSEIRNPKSETRKPKYGPIPPRGCDRAKRELNPAGALRMTELGARPALRLAGLFLALAACAGLTGCFGFLKPARDTAHRFVLTPLLAAGPVTVAPGAPAVGVGQVKLPAYLFDTSLAVRSGTNEIQYLPFVLWAERLDTGVQRILAANLAVLLPTDKVRLSTWRSEDVAAEVYVTLEQFDVDTSGRAALVAWWRILSPGGEKTLKAGESRLTRQGPSPEADAAGAVATLSELVGDLSQQLAQTIRESTPLARPAPVTR
jgi:uncharacterized lipoprotein YmbA